MKKQVRLSMQLLWSLRGDFCLTEGNGLTRSQSDAMEYTRRFLQFVADSTRYTTVQKPTTGRKGRTQPTS